MEHLSLSAMFILLLIKASGECAHPPVSAVCLSGPSVLGYWVIVIKGWRFSFPFSVTVKCWPCLWFPFPILIGWNWKEFFQVSPYSPCDRNKGKNACLVVLFFRFNMGDNPPCFPKLIAIDEVFQIFPVSPSDKMGNHRNFFTNPANTFWWKEKQMALKFLL